jgi:hypothetical protein
VVNSIHRTIQTDTQIKESQRKNRVDGFYNHRKYTIELLQNIPFGEIETNWNEYNKLNFKNAYKVYSLTFPGSSVNSDDFHPSRIIPRETEDYWISLDRIIRKYPNKSIRCQLRKHLLIELYLEKIHKSFLFNALSDKNTSKLTFSSNITQHILYTKFPSEFHIKNAIRVYWSAYVEFHIAIGIPLSEKFIHRVSSLMDFLQTLDLVDSIWDTQYTVQQSNNYPMIKWVKPLSEDPHYVHIVS